MNGLPEIDIADWKKNTSYQAGYNDDSPVIKVIISFYTNAMI